MPKRTWAAIVQALRESGFVPSRPEWSEWVRFAVELDGADPGTTDWTMGAYTVRTIDPEEARAIRDVISVLLAAVRGEEYPAWWDQLLEMNQREILDKSFPRYGEELVRLLSGNDIRINHAPGIVNHDLFQCENALQAGN